jgi:hypothetical protein
MKIKILVCLGTSVLTFVSCRMVNHHQVSDGSILAGTGTVPVPPELMLPIDEDISKEYSINDMLALQERMLQDSKIQKPISMDRFLEEMKKDSRARPMFSFWTAAYRSSSRQGATPNIPRMIMSTESGSLTISFTGESDLASTRLSNGAQLTKISPMLEGSVPGTTVKLENGDQIEVIQTDPKSFRKDFYQMVFPFGKSPSSSPNLNPRHSNSTSNTQVIKNSPVCAECHNHTKAKSLTHIWGRYPVWPGIIGSMEDFLSDKKGEFVRNQEMLTRRFGKEFEGAGNDCPDGEQKVTSTDETNDEVKILLNLKHLIASGEPRYRHLDVPASASMLYPFDDVPRGKFANRPNFRLGAVWHRLHIRNIFWEAKQSDFNRVKNLYLYGYFECSEAVGDENEHLMRATFANEIAESVKYADLAKAEIKGLKTASYNSILWMNVGLRIAGLNLPGLSIEPSPINKFALKSGYFPGGDSSERYLASLLVRDDQATVKSLPAEGFKWMKTPICNEKMGLNDYKFLRQFGYRPEAPDQQAKALLCGAIMQNLGLLK